MNQKARFASGTSQSRANQPLMPKSWLRWMVSMIEMTSIAIQPAAITATPASPRKALASPATNMMSSGRPMVYRM